MKSGNAEVVVLDHFLQVLLNLAPLDIKISVQECIGGLSHLLNASVIQFSNWPIADGYVTSLNIPANPSSVPKTGNIVHPNKIEKSTQGSPFSGLGMSFFERVLNYLYHNIINLARIVQVYILNSLFARHGYPQVFH